jgi:hypothetical protein
VKQLKTMREKDRERGGEGGRGQKGPFQTRKQPNFNPNFIGYHNNKHITTFFVTNFPDDVTTEDLWFTFAKYWKVGEVYIPAKRDKFDRRFGFARFVEVRDVPGLLERLEDTWFGTYKLRANLSRFNRGEVQPRVESGPKEVREGRKVGSDTTYTNGISFKEILGVGDGVSNTANKPKQIVPDETSSKNPNGQQGGSESTLVVQVEANTTSMAILKHSFVGTLKDEILAENIQVIIDMEGFQDIKATMLGFNKILLSSSSDGGVLRAIEVDRPWWDLKFLQISKWKSDYKASGRRIWVRIFGTPAHVWGFDCFQSITKSFGRLVCLDTQTVNQSRLDVARAQIVVSTWDFINESVVIKVGNEEFVIKVVEECFGDIDLGVKRLADSQFVGDGSEEAGSHSRSPSDLGLTAAVVGGDDDHGSGEDWIDGWSEQGEHETAASGHCPQGFVTVIPEPVVLVSDEGTSKVQLEI